VRLTVIHSQNRRSEILALLPTPLPPQAVIPKHHVTLNWSSLKTGRGTKIALAVTALD